jgi:PAS domain S-box-containing protein
MTPTGWFSDERHQNSGLPILPSLVQPQDVYRLFFDTVCSGVWMIDRNGITTYANESMSRILGYTKDEMIGMSAFAFLDEKAQDVGRQRLQSRMQGLSGRAKSCLRRKDGSNVWILASSNPLRDSSGNIVGALAFVTELDEVSPDAKQPQIRCQNLCLDTNTLKAKLDQKTIELTPFRFKLLKYLVQNKNRLISRRELLEAVWEGQSANDRLIDAHIVFLRKKLASFHGEIKTVYGEGHILKTKRGEIGETTKKNHLT